MRSENGLRALGLGALTGIRSTIAPTMLADIREQQIRELISRRYGVEEPKQHSRVIAVLEKGERLADSLPFVRTRTGPVWIAARALSGALVGKAAAGTDEKKLAPALLGAAAAVAVSFLSFRLRLFAFGRSKALGFLFRRAESMLVKRGGARLTRAAALGRIERPRRRLLLRRGQ